MRQAKKVRGHLFKLWAANVSLNINLPIILGDPGAASWGDGIFTGESLQKEQESPWAFTLTERVPEAFEILPSDWPENFSGHSASEDAYQ